MDKYEELWREWIDGAEHHKRIQEMKPLYEMPEYVKERCAALKEISAGLKVLGLQILTNEI